MGKRATEEQIAAVRSVVGGDFSEMDIIRALHLSNNDPEAAINILFDTPHVRVSSSSSSNGEQAADQRRRTISEPKQSPCSSRAAAGSSDSAAPASNSPEKEGDWWLVGTSDLSGLSTCKGRKIKAGDAVGFSFGSLGKLSSPSSAKLPERRRVVSSCSEIVRFSTQEHGEIGRIPNEWGRCLSALVRDNKIKAEGHCKNAPDFLNIMDSIVLSVSVYINLLMLCDQHHISACRLPTEDSSVSPLPILFRLLGLNPFKKAEIIPEDLCTRKRPAESKKLSASGSNIEDNQETISESDLDNIVGITNSSDLEEMDPPSTLLCELRSYQKQALHWMVQLEKGNFTENAASTIHPCWDAYHLADERKLVVYLNAFSGDATTEFPSTLQIARGGILADAMGLGKTIMTLSLILLHSDKADPSGSLGSQISCEVTENGNQYEQSRKAPKRSTETTGFIKLLRSKSPRIGGGNLIVCPMTLLGQWKAEIETHAQAGSLTLYVHYGQSRLKDAKYLAENDVVLTTYGVLASEFSSDNAEDAGGLYSVQWFRVVLDEAHTIKSSKSQISVAAAALIAERRWCLTGTPVQNNLEDIYSLLRFLRVEPWESWALWNRLVQKPYEEGDERGLKMVQSILKPIMLRRTKFSTNREGRPILVLPPANVQVIYCELAAAEMDFYDALFTRSKVKFNQFVEQGRVLHNYASILELLLRLRQCCDHPFLVMSRGDTQEFSDLNKLAKHFLKGSKDAAGGYDSAPSRSFVREVVEELRKGEEGECPICLEAFEDAVLTPCAHRLCRECLLASWRSATAGLCPVCRKMLYRQDLITAPSDSRFHIDVEKNWVESSKTLALLEELEKIRPSGSKSIVFSQWTAFLDLLQIPLSRKNITYCHLDGTLNQNQREKVISQFTEDPLISVMLMSLKAGGVGINLTVACNAFLLDPWWNPAVEEQAVMRIHRIGQTKNVTIRRFIVKGTVEERMEAVQARKQRMISGALTDQEVRTARLEELKMLFT